jgi:hypothetical protein
MQRDYEIAVMMTTALRSSQAHMKLYRQIREVFDHFGYRDTNQAAHNPRYDILGMLAYVSPAALSSLREDTGVHQTDLAE